MLAQSYLQAQNPHFVEEQGKLVPQKLSESELKIIISKSAANRIRLSIIQGRETTGLWSTIMNCQLKKG